MNPDKAKKVLSSSNKRFVVMGRFNATGSNSDATKGVTFSGASGVNGPKLSAVDFFEQIVPELRYVRDKTMRVGSTAFNSFKLVAPREGGTVGHGQPITADSPLLAQGGGSSGSGETPQVRWQNSGGRLLQELLKDLDQVARFADGKFSAALLKLTRRYMVDYADGQSSDDKVDRADWQRLAFDHAASSSILNYMTCYRSDEENARSQVSRALDAQAQGDGASLTPARVSLLLDGLEGCKRACEAGRQDDRLLSGIARESEYAYLKDYPGSSTFGITVSGAANKTFVEHYRYYLERSSAVHRFVRNGSLHSYLFLWLAGKYQKFENKDQLALGTARSMYAVGVEGQGDKRMPGETAEERKRNFELVRDTESAVSNQEKAKIQGEIYERMQAALQEGILEQLRPERTFRRAALNRRNRELFVFLGQMAGGKAGQILGQATQKAAELARIYRAAKNVRAKEGEALDTEAYAKAFDKLRPTKEMEPFLAALKQEVADLEVDADSMSEAVCVAVVRRIAAETKTYFDESWLGDLDNINEEVAVLGQVYDLRNKIDVERRSEDSLGSAMTVLTGDEISILAPVETSAEERQAYAKSVEKAAIAAGASNAGAPASVALPVPTRLEEGVRANQTGVIKNEEGRDIATLESDVERGLLLATMKAEVSSEELLSAGAKLDFGAELSGLELQEVDLDLQPLVDTNEKQSKHLETLAGKSDAYSQTQSLLRKKYVEDRSAKGDTSFTRAARALALGEYMAAAPPQESNLGVADLSNVMGVVLDMVEHVGEVDEAKLFEVGGPPLPEDVLGRMNLSQHYPVNDAGELSNVLQYHHDQCQSLGELEEYFGELRSLRTLFDSLEGSDAEVTVYNCTLADHASEDVVDFSRDLFLVKQHPVVAYLTAQSAPTEASLLALGNRVTEELRNRSDDTTDLQMPIIITSAAVKQAGVFPVVSGATVELPALAPEGSTAADTLPCGKPDLDPYLALAASLVASGDTLGQLGDVTPRQRRKLNEVLKVTAQRGQSLVALFREAWFGLESPLLPALCMTKWLNICLLHGAQSTEGLQKLLGDNCLEALKAASDRNNHAEYMAPHAFAELSSMSAEELLGWMPSVFTGSTNEPMASRNTKVAFASGALGVRQQQRTREFGGVSFAAALAAAVSGRGGGEQDQGEQG